MIYSGEEMTEFLEAIARQMDGERRAEMQHFFSELQNQDSIGEEMRDMFTVLLQKIPEDRMRKIDFSKVQEKYWSIVFEFVTMFSEVLDMDQYPEWLTKYA
jgi:hypothetical protein